MTDSFSKRSRGPGRGAALAVLAALMACSCAGRRTPPAGPRAASASPARDPKIALVLGGGAARGFAHVGVIRVLAEEKIPIGMIVGTSAGSLIGALYAAGSDPFDLEWTAFKLEKDDIFDYSILSSWRGTVAGERIEAFVNENIKAKSIEEAKIPFFAVAADLLTGERIVLDTGPFGRAVRASSAIPGVFQPVALGDRMLVDGGVVDTIPSDVARERGADLVIAVDIGRELSHEPPSSSVGIVLQSISIMAREISRTGLASADVAIAPRVGAVASFDFSKKRECVAAGIAAAREALPRIRALIDAWKRSHATS